MTASEVGYEQVRAWVEVMLGKTHATVVQHHRLDGPLCAGGSARHRQRRWPAPCPQTRRGAAGHG